MVPRIIFIVTFSFKKSDASKMVRNGLVDERGIAIDASISVKLENNNDPPRLKAKIPATPRNSISILVNFFN